MRTNLIIFLIVALILSGVGNYLQYRSAEIAQRDRNLEAKEFRNQAKESLSKIEARDGQIKALLNDKDSIIKTHAESQGRLKRQANASRARITGPPVVQDTVIIYLDSLVADLEAEKDTVYLVNNMAIDSLQRSNLELSELFKGQLSESIRLQNHVDREKRKHWSVGPAAGVDYRGRPTISIVITRDLWRF